MSFDGNKVLDGNVLKMLRQAQHEDVSGLHPELVEGYNAN
jgi:hypothetical protein